MWTSAAVFDDSGSPHVSSSPFSSGFNMKKLPDSLSRARCRCLEKPRRRAPLQVCARACALIINLAIVAGRTGSAAECMAIGSGPLGRCCRSTQNGNWKISSCWNPIGIEWNKTETCRKFACSRYLTGRKKYHEIKTCLSWSVAVVWMFCSHLCLYQFPSLLYTSLLPSILSPTSSSLLLAFLLPIIPPPPPPTSDIPLSSPPIVSVLLHYLYPSTSALCRNAAIYNPFSLPVRLRQFSSSGLALRTLRGAQPPPPPPAPLESAIDDGKVGHRAAAAPLGRDCALCVCVGQAAGTRDHATLQLHHPACGWRRVWKSPG